MFHSDSNVLGFEHYSIDSSRSFFIRLVLVLALLKLVQVIDIALQSLTLDRERHLVIVSLQLVRIDNLPDNLLLVRINLFVLSAHDRISSGNLTVSIVAAVSVLKHLFKLDQALPRDENVVVPQQVWHVEASRCLHSYVLQIARRKLEVSIGWLAASEEAQFVLLEG